MAHMNWLVIHSISCGTGIFGGNIGLVSYRRLENVNSDKEVIG